ncbi:MAG: hypothetical protein WDW36_008478 [Sanguina aurantia]
MCAPGHCLPRGEARRVSPHLQPPGRGWSLAPPESNATAAHMPLLPLPHTPGPWTGVAAVGAQLRLRRLAVCLPVVRTNQRWHLRG